MARKVMDVPQWQEFEVAIMRALPKDIDPDLAQKWIEDKIGLPRALRNILIPQWPVWKVLKLGTGLRTANDFRAALKRGGNRISDWANDILGKPAFTAASQEIEVDLVLVSAAELGYKDGATYRDICQRAKEFGLDRCPAEVGPQLRQQYTDQPLNERLVIAMEPITGSSGGLFVFVVVRYDVGLWLYSGDGHPDCFWDGSSRFVFIRRK